jgi:hypothetical protein
MGQYQGNSTQTTGERWAHNTLHPVSIFEATYSPLVVSRILPKTDNCLYWLGPVAALPVIRR